MYILKGLSVEAPKIPLKIEIGLPPSEVERGSGESAEEGIRQETRRLFLAQSDGTGRARKETRNWLEMDKYESGDSAPLG